MSGFVQTRNLWPAMLDLAAGAALCPTGDTTPLERENRATCLEPPPKALCSQPGVEVSGGGLAIRLPTKFWCGSIMESSRRAPLAGSGSRGECQARSSAALLAVVTGRREEAVVAKVVLGVDPHKRMNAVVVINSKGKILACRQFANTAGGFRELKTFWRQWRPRTWAVQGCNGVGKHLAQPLSPRPRR